MRIPKHIGIIPDGNRRWAKNKGLYKEMGYSHGLDPGLSVVREAKKYGVKEITFYGFTLDNCGRPKEQVAAFQKACVSAVKATQEEGDICILVVGNSSSPLFPKELVAYTEKREFGTPSVQVNFLVNYGWDWDLSAIEGGGDKKNIQKQLHSKDISRMDMIIRWGGMRRLSGFLPVQSVYSDFFVVEDLWPDYQPSHFHDAINWYQNQDVTLGG